MPYPTSGKSGQLFQASWVDANSYFIDVAIPGTAHTKGSWTTIIPSVTRELNGFWLFSSEITDLAGDPGGTIIFDVAIGAASAEIPVAESIFLRGAPYRNTAVRMYIPLRIPAGSRVSVRAQADQAAITITSIGILGVVGPVSSVAYGRMTTYGVNLGTSRAVKVPGGYGGGAITQITASTTRPARALSLVLGRGDVSSAVGNTFFDIMVGGSGSEQILIPKIPISLFIGGTSPIAVPIPVAIPSGTRLSMRGFINGTIDGLDCALCLYE